MKWGNMEADLHGRAGRVHQKNKQTRNDRGLLASSSSVAFYPSKTNQKSQWLHTALVISPDGETEEQRDEVTGWKPWQCEVSEPVSLLLEFRPSKATASWGGAVGSQC